MSAVKRSGSAYIWLPVVAVLAIVAWIVWKKTSGDHAHPAANAIESRFTIRDRFAISLVAKEPDVINPMTMCVDPQGAIYVSESSTYRYGLEGSPSKDTLNPIKRIELGPDGRPTRVTVVAQGFANPVMGIDIYRNKLYATCLNELFVMDVEPDGQLTNRKVLVRDSAQPWNPFGMYRVMVGPDARLWLAIADHPDSKPVTLTGSDGSKVQLRGQSGGFARCNLDGSALEMVVQGFRAPFAFDIDPWGHLWAISNGEGSPNIYVDVIPGMDYGYHSRNVSYAWLAGKTSLSPPVTEMGPGANTVALHYYSSMFPADFWGSILIANWGSHGAYPTNRIIRQFVRQEAAGSDSVATVGEVFRESDGLFLSSTDSLFRPVGMTTAPDGGLYLADWHGQDDESDSTGRIFKISYPGSTGENDEHPGNFSTMSAGELCRLLDSRNRFVRVQAQDALAQLGQAAITPLTGLLESGSAFAAAQAIWTLTQINSEAAAQAMTAALRHKDARVRAFGLRQLRQAAGEPIGGPPYRTMTNSNNEFNSPRLLSPEALATLAATLTHDPDQEVRVEAALSQHSPDAISEGLLNALDIATSKRLRYQIGFELGRYGNTAALRKLHTAADPGLQRIALIAAQTAIQEKSPLAAAVAGWDLSKDENAAKDLIARIEAGKANPKQAADRLIALDWLEAHPQAANPPLAAFLLDCIRDNDYMVQAAALRTMRQRALQDEKIKEAVQAILHKSHGPLLSFLQLEALYTLGSFANPGPAEDWLPWLKDSSAQVVTAALRALREQPRDAGFVNSLWPAGLAAAQRSPQLAEEALFSFKKAGADAAQLEKLPQPPARPANKEQLGKAVLAALPQASAQRGRWSFNGTCVTCHSAKSDDGAFRLGPNLASIGAASQPGYLIESILEPSKVLKTGFQIETVETTDGQVYSGQIETRGQDILIKRAGAAPVTVPMAAVKKRTTSHVSPMPDGLYHEMTVKELADLTAYLMTLKGGN